MAIRRSRTRRAGRRRTRRAGRRRTRRGGLFGTPAKKKKRAWNASDVALGVFAAPVEGVRLLAGEGGGRRRSRRAGRRRRSRRAGYSRSRLRPRAYPKSRYGLSGGRRRSRRR